MPPSKCKNCNSRFPSFSGLTKYGFDVTCTACAKERHSGESHTNPDYDAHFDPKSKTSIALVKDLCQDLKAASSTTWFDEKFSGDGAVDEVMAAITEYITSESLEFDGKPNGSDPLFFLDNHDTLSLPVRLKARIMVNMKREGKKSQEKAKYQNDEVFRETKLKTKRETMTCDHCLVGQILFSDILSSPSFDAPCWQCLRKHLLSLPGDPTDPLAMKECGDNGWMLATNPLCKEISNASNNDEPWAQTHISVDTSSDVTPRKLSYLFILEFNGDLSNLTEARRAEALHKWNRFHELHEKRRVMNLKYKMNIRDQKTGAAQAKLEKEGVVELSPKNRSTINEAVGGFLDLAEGMGLKGDSLVSANYAGVWTGEDDFISDHEPLRKYVKAAYALFGREDGSVPVDGEDMQVTYLSSQYMNDLPALEKKMKELIQEAKAAGMVAIIAIALHPPVSQSSAHEVEESTLSTIRSREFLSTEGSVYRKGATSNKSPFAVTSVVVAPNILTAVKNGKLYLNTKGTACFKKDMVKYVPVAHDDKSWRTSNGSKKKVNVTVEMAASAPDRDLPSRLARYRGIVFSGDTTEHFDRTLAEAQLAPFKDSMKSLNREAKKLLVLGTGHETNAKYKLAKSKPDSYDLMTAEKFKFFNFGVQKVSSKKRRTS